MRLTENKELVVANPYHALPCSLEHFYVKGQKADKDDFGDNVDNDFYGDRDRDEYSVCVNMHFEGKPYTREILEKYNITPEEYEEIVNELESVLYVGTCSWCG